MSTAHIFYIPVILLVGIFAGYFLGRNAAERQARHAARRRRRKEAIRGATSDDE